MEVCSSVNDKHKNCTSSLEGAFDESLHICDAEKSEHASKGHEISNVVEENLCQVIKPKEAKLNMAPLKKLATFPIPDEKAASVSESPSQYSAHQTYSRSISLPAPSELKSAMKGSRDKNGEGHVKLTVKWAADVYDPIPTLVSHTVKNKKQPKTRKKKKNDKKSLKKDNKGNSARGGSGKDKKQSRKDNKCEQSDLCYQSSDSHVIEGSSDFDSVDVCSQDSKCGAIFLKKSVTEMHYPVAEAQ